MAEPILFSKADFDNLELVRQIVLRRLRDDSGWHQFDFYWHEQSFVRFEIPQLQSRFLVLANEIMWQLISQGVITPGLNASNPSLPFFRITDYGASVLEAERFLAHDPTGYLQELREVGPTVLNDAVVGYVEEALRCFTSGCHIASVLLLGVAAEGVFLALCNAVSASLINSAERRDFDSLPDLVKPRHRWIVRRYQALSREVRQQLPESLDLTLTSLYELIRRQRNELGHPQTELPTLDRERAFLFFRLFPGFVGDIEAFVAHCREERI